VSPETHFKGWAKPGPIPPGLGAPNPDPARCDQRTGPEAVAPLTVEPHESLDAISGHFRLFQLRDGHRFSTDDILTAWYGTCLLYTSDAADDLLCVDLGGRRIIKKKKKKNNT